MLDARAMSTKGPTNSPSPLKLDPSFYSLTEYEKAFFQQLTGIIDDDELKAHIISVQTKAYEKLNYPCIWGFSFLRLGISQIPAYKEVQRLRNERTDPIFLDIATGFGNGLRKVVLDGWPIENAIASDLNQEFWDFGHELFRSNPKTFPVGFVVGDIFDPSTLAPRGAYIDHADIDTINSEPLPPLQELTSLTPLQGRVSVIHAESFFHLFSEEKQLDLAHRMSSLLNPQPGSIICGSQVALPEKGFWKGTGWHSDMFCHSPQSWRDMWMEVFDHGDGKGAERVEVETRMFQQPVQSHWSQIYHRCGDQREVWTLFWSVRRI